MALAMERLRKIPLTLSKNDFVELIEEADDRMLYERVRASMSEVFDMVPLEMAAVERQSAMGLMYDTVKKSEY